MNNTISVIIPEGYEFKKFADPILSNGGGALTVLLKKKQTKDFDFYVDEYLRSDDYTTNDMLCNWLEKDQLDKIGNNLKQNKLQFVPWEVKIGLLKFICKDNGIDVIASCHYYENFIKGNSPNRERFDKLKQILPINFIESIVQ